MDPDAGRAERDDMIDAFDGLDRYIPRPVRAELIAWQQQGAGLLDAGAPVSVHGR